MVAFWCCDSFGRFPTAEAVGQTGGNIGAYAAVLLKRTALCRIRAIAKGPREARSGRRGFLRPEEVGRFRCRKENQRHSRALAYLKQLARFVRRDVTTA